MRVIRRAVAAKYPHSTLPDNTQLLTVCQVLACGDIPAWDVTAIQFLPQYFSKIHGINLAIGGIRDQCAMGRALDPVELQPDALLVEILRYVVAHPKAKDTISGIEKWWLSQSISGEGRKRIEALLNSLVTKGWFIARGSPQAETIYSLNENHLHEIQEFLTKDTNRQPLDDK